MLSVVYIIMQSNLVMMRLLLLCYINDISCYRDTCFFGRKRPFLHKWAYRLPQCVDEIIYVGICYTCVVLVAMQIGGRRGFPLTSIWPHLMETAGKAWGTLLFVLKCFNKILFFIKVIFALYLKYLTATPPHVISKISVRTNY